MGFSLTRTRAQGARFQTRPLENPSVNPSLHRNPRAFESTPELDSDSTVPLHMARRRVAQFYFRQKYDIFSMEPDFRQSWAFFRQKFELFPAVYEFGLLPILPSFVLFLRAEELHSINFPKHLNSIAPIKTLQSECARLRHSIEHISAANFRSQW